MSWKTKLASSGYHLWNFRMNLETQQIFTQIFVGCLKVFLFEIKVSVGSVDRIQRSWRYSNIY